MEVAKGGTLCRGPYNQDSVMYFWVCVRVPLGLGFRLGFKSHGLGYRV